MKKEIFIYYCRCLYQIYGLPIRIYNNNALVLKEELVPLPDSLETIFGDSLLPRVEHTQENLVLFQSVNLLSYGYIKNKNSSLAVIVGPVPATESNGNTYLASTRTVNNTVLPDKIYQALETYLNTIPVMQIGRFSYILSSVFAVIYEKIITPDEMKIIKPTAEYDPDIHKDAVYHYEELAYGDIEKSNYYDYEKRFLKLIKHGMTEQLSRIWQEASANVMTHGNEYTSLRAAKNKCIIAIGLVSNAALEAGLPQADIYKMRNAYIAKTENCYNVKEVVDLRFNLMIDFCQQVENFKYAKTNVPIVNYAIKYINDNSDKKLTLQEIADYVHASKSYLCSEFSKAMSVSIVTYIQEQKVKRAKEFLMLTDKSLSEISELLSFSTQSYFQNIFKQVTGMTPTEFRKQSQL